jgi:AraC-like DNA-binding protein
MEVPFSDIVATYLDAPHRRLVDLRPDGLAEVPSFGWLCYAKARPDLPIHRHFGCLEVHFRDRGEQHFQLGDETYLLRGGDLFLTLPDESHSTGGWPSEVGSMYWFTLKLPPNGEGMLGLSREESWAILDRLLNPPCRQFRATSRTRALFAEVLRLHYSQQLLMRTVRMRLAMCSLLLEIMESAARRAAGSQTSQQVAEAILAIQKAPHEPYRIPDLARKAHLSASQFKSRFKKETGVSPWQYILNARIDVAKQRLITGNESITQIAMDLGFASSQYFATTFKRITGVTPLAYRRGAFPHGPSQRCDDGQD